MINGLWIKNLNEAIIADEYVDICESQKDILVVIESYEEFVDTLNYSYAVILRMYEDFKHDSKCIWLHRQSDLEWGNKLIGRNKYFLGEYTGPLMRRLKKEIKQFAHRRLVVRPLWIEMYQHQLTFQGLI